MLDVFYQCRFLANIPITLHEINWHHTFHHDLAQLASSHGPHLFIRYVDNRLVIAPTTSLRHQAFKTLALTDFYQLPIQLEQVGDFHFLGFELNLPLRTVTYIQPTAAWQVRDVQSAGSSRLTLSGLLSRATNIHRYTYPPAHSKASIQQLVQCHVQKGHDQLQCQRTVQKLLRTPAPPRPPPSSTT